MRLNEIYGKYRDQVRFYVIYIREAHPDDGWRVPENLRQNIRFREPRSEAERKAVATLCQINLDLQMPMLVDTIDNSVEESLHRLADAAVSDRQRRQDRLYRRAGSLRLQPRNLGRGNKV